MNLPIGIFEEDIRPIQNQYPNIDLKEAIVLFLRRDNRTYGNIQKKLGNPSKKWIREVLLKYEPSLVNIQSY